MSSSSSSNSGWIYDVFVSFRGEDTRKTFVSHLDAALSNAGINTFIDYRLEKGAEIVAQLVRAIQGSRMSLIVLSLDYASSRWCLDELVKVRQCDRTDGQMVVPIFYDVYPSDVRHQTGAFGERFKALVDKCLLQGMHHQCSSWRDALTTVANLAGCNSRNFRSDGELVDQIVEDIFRKLDMDLLTITEFPVGLESRVQQVIDFINHQSGRGCVVGIWGMGGSGKTTIAKFIYNQIRLRFKRRGFIEASNRGHIDLQEKLLSDVLRTKVKVHSIAMGISMIEKRFCGERTLIVLDDVTEFAQLKALCGNCKWIGVGSVVVITTRDVRLLKLLEVDYVYKMEEMDENESLELFSQHAFREEKPSEDFNELARNVVAYCGGLPLALEVLGSYLIKRTKKVWESVLLKLEKIPNYQVQKILRISFDGLSDPLEKDIFLDVCCFFIGKDRAYVTEILNGCGLCADIGITVLIERSLIKVEKNNKLGMHPLLREMGREIICESSRIEPGKRSRLWFQKDVLDVLTRNTGTEAIQGLSLKLRFTIKDCFEAYAFVEMKGLRLLQLDHVLLSGNYGYLSKQLRWVSWQGFALKYIPNNFDLKGVIAIDFKHSSLRLLWKKPQVLQCLKILNLSHSKYLIETPDFSGLPSLEKLILKDCPSLCKVHQSIGDLRDLLLINLKNCTSLSNLPREMYKLKSLKTLILSGCLKIDKLEEDIVQMESLTTLIAENIAVKQVPFSIVSSKSIGYISLCGYEGPLRILIPSIIWSWMSPRMNPLSRIHSIPGTSSLGPMDMQNNDLGDLALLFSNLSNQRSVLMQCDTKFQLSKQLGTILDFTKSELTSYTSQVLKHSLESYLIGIGSYAQGLNSLSRSISEGLATNESCDDFLPGDNYPHWLAYTGDGHSVYFTVPENCCMKGMTLCVVYLSTPENTATECLTSVIMVNYTKCNIQIFKRDTVISFNDVDWQCIISHLGLGDEVEIFVTFRHGLVVKKMAVYLMYGESVL
uniref:ADP-ribosyl cyclase/cyclic ADP-ribose hydrolase n=1 Tax=Cajanus cajan TaxID=3821 RepID=A0A151SH46_CAJCA|nr:TMV resistance protein N [Cajanus cajan]